MENQNLAELLRVSTELEASTVEMEKKCSGYQDSSRTLHRELESLVQLYHQEPELFRLNTELYRCAVDFFEASRLIGREAEKMQGLGLEKAEKHIQILRERLATPEHFDSLEMVNKIDARLKSCEQNIQLAHQYVRQLNAYVQYHARVLETIKLD